MRVFGRPGSLEYLPPEGGGEGRRRPPQRDPCEIEQERRAAVREAAAGLFAERGPVGVTRRHAADAAKVPGAAVERLYGSEAELLGDVLADFAHGLVMAVCVAFDAGEGLGPTGRLEGVVRAWLDYVSAHRAANRTFLLCLPRAGEPVKTQAASKYRTAVDTVVEALRKIAPELDEDPCEGLVEMVRALLSDVWSWPDGARPEGRGAAARRIAGVLTAAAMAEARGSWAGFGPAAGAGEPGNRALDYTEARKRFSGVLDYVLAGGEVTVRRHGKPVGKVVSAVTGNGCGREAGGVG